MKSVMMRYREWEDRQKKTNRQLKYVPGTRNVFLFIAFVLVPAFAILALFDASANHWSFSWPFIAAFGGMFSYGFLTVLNLGPRKTGAYMIIGFVALKFSPHLLDADALSGQIGWGGLIGWFAGMASISFFMWLRLRNEWNAKNPGKMC